MRLIDTNILAYLLIEGDETESARALYERDQDWRSESLILVEFCNVLIRYMEVRNMKLETAREFLVKAETLLDGKLSVVPHHTALSLAAHYHVTAYDARFLAVAHQSGVRLTTEDARLRNAAPNLTQSLAEALAA